MKYTLILDRIKNKSKLCLLSKRVKELNNIIGIIIIIINSDIEGVIYDNTKFIDSNEIRFLLNNLIPSLKGCIIPIIPTLLGPFRIWIYLKIFRSKIV